MDLVAMALVALGLAQAAQGHLPLGGAITASGLILLAVLALDRRWTTVLPFSFGSHFIVMPVCVIAYAVLQRRAPALSFAAFGFWIYYHACIALRERKVRYVPGAGFSWRVAHRTERPRVYWGFVSLSLAVAAVLFAISLASA